ncbi:NUDIX domain-containing protein [Hydrogenovibrio sp. 3SP14C1]|uniref:NUDIX domain-containing protein n=1 Tax=Hydrogenovibrio sp. 3SP14C1 TaxID=3038774 RepID=UPI00241647F6|nr:NUDIX domain-containing protein [Hydrogenovibrio sp. 3SP14C1]MDG4813020.1 NUDIX domain-containing protein [Hydrogenovibrio sp. 3SP14C1]
MAHTKKIELLKTHHAYDGFFKIDKLTYRHTLFKGGWTPAIDRELFKRGEAVIVLLYDLQAEVVVLIEQCRAGALPHASLKNDQAWLIEPVAGMVEPGESNLAACKREAFEEAGVTGAKFEYICQFYPSPGGSDEILHLYGAEVDSTALPDYAGEASEVEDIRLIKMPFSRAKSKLMKAEFNVASTIIALQWLLFQKL